MKKLKYIFLIILSTFLLSFSSGQEIAAEVISFEPEAVKEKEAEAFEATLLAVGDIIFHLPQIKEAVTEEGYDFSLPFEKIKPYISGADVAIGNFETTVNEKRALSGYPRFNSPPEVLEGIRNAGFDVMVTANNHSMDTGVEGAKNTAALIKKNNMIPVGVGEGNKSAVIEVKGIKLGILAYATSINGLKAPVGFVSMAEEGQIKKDIDELKGKSDFIIVYLHAGVEYNRAIETETMKLFRTVADLGADAVLGSHPHVVRKSELYKTRGRQVFINYSMGNFLSNQNDKYTDIGTMTRLKIRKQRDLTELAGYEILPTYRLRFRDTDGKTRRRIIPVSDIGSYVQITEKDKLYIREVSSEAIKLFEEESQLNLSIKDLYE